MRFEGMDRNNDGVITRDEWRGSSRSFDVHDWNGDGRLSGAEVQTGPLEDFELADHDPSRYERYIAWTDSGFYNLDHNRDRLITPNEWHFDRETFLRVDRNRDGALDRSEFLGTDVDDDRGDRFGDLDANNNGRVERSEWHGSPGVFEWLDRNNDGQLTRVEVVGPEDQAESVDRFANLDYDRNGTLSRDEWHWSVASFNRLDLNRDGALSRREFAIGADSQGGSAAPHHVRVNPQHEWSDAGINVRAGEVLTFSARGTIYMMPGPSDAASPAGSLTGRRAAGAPVNAPAGALIGRIEDSAPFLIGDRRSVPVTSGGRLYLGVNDDHMPDNSGEFQVTVTVRSGRN
jgi:Ca2+-binding EF-hand superfamily protein